MTSDGAAGVIDCRGLGKRYRRPAWTRHGSHHRGARAGGDVWALRGVDLAVDHPVSLGVLGRNGAGKSTLLRLLAGVGRPDEGRLQVQGRVSALLELGGEFRPELTGRDNARLAGLVAGLRRRTIDALLDDITAFAGLEDAIDSPLRTYSSGMQARLAFAVATQLRPDVLLVDEVLAVGDLSFRARCIERINGFRAEGATIVLVSHEPALVRALCERTIWLEGGRLVADGPTSDVLDRYTEAMGERTRSQTPAELEPTTTEHGVPLLARENRFGTQRATVRSLRIVTGAGTPGSTVISGAGLSVVLEIDAPAELGAVHVAVVLRRRDGLACIEAGSLLPVEARAGGAVECTLSIERLDVAPGAYALDAGVWSSDWQVTHDLHAGAYPLTVLGDAHPDAVLAPPMWWAFRTTHAESAR